jgi:hypothetical protein
LGHFLWRPKVHGRKAAVGITAEEVMAEVVMAEEVMAEPQDLA